MREIFRRFARNRPALVGVAVVVGADPDDTALPDGWVGSAVVVESGKVVGMFTERDYARKVVLQGRSSKTTSVGELETTNVLYVSPDDSIENCMAIMTDKRLRHLPVMDQGKLVGLISIGDLVKDIITEQKFIIEQLQHYITGDRG